MSKSIMHQKDGTCYLCMLLNGDYDDHKITEEHHAVFGWANRNLAERYGLKVYICPEHHRNGKNAAHKNYKIAKLLQEKAQEAFERENPNLSFRAIFGMNYKSEEKPVATSQEPKKSKDEEPGFRFLEEEEINGTQESRIQRT